MNIIFGELPQELRQRHLVLELDTFRDSAGNTCTAWCVIENIALTEFSVLEHYVKIHQDLLQAYRDRNWQYCQHAIEGLYGKWNGELDSFYNDLAQRVQQYQSQDLDDQWDHCRRITSAGLLNDQ